MALTCTSRRLIYSFGATIAGPLVTVLIQLITVPLMLKVWGAELYGEWLVLTAIPTYLLLTDLGFGNVAASDMTMRANAGDRDGAIETFQSTIALVLILTAAMMVMLAGFALRMPAYAWLHLRAVSAPAARTTLLLLSLNCLVILQWSVIMAAYRCAGRFAAGMLFVNCIRMAEAASVLALLFVHAGPVRLAAWMLAISSVGTLWLVVDHSCHVAWLRFGVRNASRIRMRLLAGPALAYMVFPACAALNTQGITLTIGHVIGPVAVACFSPLRTLARTALQLTDAVRTSVWPELSAAYGRRDWPLARRLHRSAFQIALLLAVAALGLLALCGPRVFAVWTHARMPFDAAAFHILLIAVLANSMWNASSAVPLSANRHEKIAPVYLALSLGSLLIAWVLLPATGLRGAAFAMLFTDAGMSCIVLRVSNRLLFDTTGAFAWSMFDFNFLRVLLGRS